MTWKSWPMPAFAIAYAVFPRLARTSPEEVVELIADGCRLVILATAIVVLPLVLFASAALRAAFGASFASATLPSILLTLASLPLAVQFFR